MKNFTSIKDEIQKIASSILREYNLQVYEINNFFDFESDVLQILVEDMTEPNKALDFDSIISSNEKLSDALEDFPGLSEPYMLEVASAGIEKPIRSKEEMLKAINSYVHVELNQEKSTNIELEGILLDFDVDKDTFRITYFLKGQKKKVDFKYEQVKFARYAVKF
ncbi:ribosome assembly cofactor RimP [Mesoplasma chauliocola]|uniref:Ribosome maturation factor RimP n=1 Tax=Mesoplasma chauliocola TaxID=216427 RepID=A0A249SN74_9MOLU|nr:ribosome maturation factor RimP [Mesoplasma chauliocola]ASZ09049.1 ribosome assembly cofactor RimP [Mesoplasma chauliocola]